MLKKLLNKLEPWASVPYLLADIAASLHSISGTLKGIEKSYDTVNGIDRVEDTGLDAAPDFLCVVGERERN